MSCIGYMSIIKRGIQDNENYMSPEFGLREGQQVWDAVAPSLCSSNTRGMIYPIWSRPDTWCLLLLHQWRLRKLFMPTGFQVRICQVLSNSLLFLFLLTHTPASNDRYVSNACPIKIILCKSHSLNPKDDAGNSTLLKLHPFTFSNGSCLFPTTSWLWNHQGSGRTGSKISEGYSEAGPPYAYVSY